jgi:hypothetical protein
MNTFMGVIKPFKRVIVTAGTVAPDVGNVTVFELSSPESA